MAGFTVYMHIFPNGKRYIGITSQTVNRRWRNGYGYFGQPVYNAILKYGWDNIRHEILFTGLTQKEAERKEIELIKAFDTTSHKNGYNVEYGGDCRVGSDEAKIKLSRAGKARFEKGYVITPENYAKLHSACVEAHSMPVICIETKIIYKSSEEAQRQTGINAINIGRCCKKHQYRKTAGGYHWEYVSQGVVK